MVVEILRTMCEEGCAVVIATHDDAVRDRCDMVLTVGDATRPVPVREAVLLLAAVVVPAVYGTHAGTLLGRIGLRIF
ncbi:hypothetical protein [Streptomyces sp. CG 926]|uniref:hypothetical protein n=1 Tax=Streptomyces sp. CG 926 TaxID=1882405 RepID=UPI001C633EF2|nr:hypothetical protein [Streptomyces sp. CG 926]